MTNDARTPDDIERDIADERAQLSDTINDLQKKFSVEAIVHDLGDMFRDQGGDLGRMIGRTVGRNPAALALIGAGVAWLWLGQDRNHDHGGPRHSGHDRDGHHHRPSSDQWDKKAVASGTARSKVPTHDGDRFWFDEDTIASPTRPDRGEDSSADTGGTTPAAGAVGGVIGSIRDSAGAVAGAVSDAAGSLRDTAMDLTARLSHGTDGLSAEAKARVLAARQAAHDARVATEAVVRRGRHAAGNFFEDQPLVLGALAMALGAAVGGALPRSQIEDDKLGASSDRLFAEAQAIFREERAKAMLVLHTAADEAKGAIHDTGSDLAGLLPDGKSPGDVIVDRLTDAATRVLDGAKAEAERQGLGKHEA